MVNTDQDLNQFGERIRKQMGDRERDERKRQMQRPVQRYGAAAGRSASQNRLGHQTSRRTQGRVTGSAVEATRQAGRGRRSRAVARAHLALVAVDIVAASHGGRRAPLGLGHRTTGLRLLLLRQDLSPGRQSQRLHSRHGPRRPRRTRAIPRNRARREPRAPARAPLNGEGWRRLSRGRSDEIHLGARGGRG